MTLIRFGDASADPLISRQLWRKHQPFKLSFAPGLPDIL